MWWDKTSVWIDTTDVCLVDRGLPVIRRWPKYKHQMRRSCPKYYLLVTIKIWQKAFRFKTWIKIVREVLLETSWKSAFCQPYNPFILPGEQVMLVTIGRQSGTTEQCTSVAEKVYSMGVFNIKIPSNQSGDLRYKTETNLYSGYCSSTKITSLYWISILEDILSSKLLERFLWKGVWRCVLVTWILLIFLHNIPSLTYQRPILSSGVACEFIFFDTFWPWLYNFCTLRIGIYVSVAIKPVTFSFASRLRTFAGAWLPGIWHGTVLWCVVGG